MLIEYFEYVRIFCSWFFCNEVGLIEVFEIYVYIRFVYYNVLIKVFENEYEFNELYIVDIIFIVSGIKECWEKFKYRIYLNVI